MITFSVSDVEPHKGDSFETHDIAHQWADRGLKKLEGQTPEPEQPLVKGLSLHGLVMAARQAYDAHLPLSLSPDHIWLAIAQGAARHILLHAEELRSLYVPHEGKTPLVFVDNTLQPGSPDNDWAPSIDGLSKLLQQHIGEPLHRLFVSDFSTTGTTERLASEVVLLGAMQKYFVTIVKTRCGIPSITLEGTVDDWRALVERARALDTIRADTWLKQLIPILEYIARTAAGDINRAFWQDMYNVQEASGHIYVTGWINAFFPYLGDDVDQHWVNPWFTREDYTELQHLPSGLTRAPFTWDYFETLFPMEFVSGFVGVTQDPATLTLRPHISWAVAPASQPSTFVPTTDDETNQLMFMPRSPQTLTSMEGLAEEANAIKRPFWLVLEECSALETLDGIEQVPYLDKVEIVSCPNLTDVHALAHAKSLRVLEVWDCPNLPHVILKDHDSIVAWVNQHAQT
ncbi:MAG: DUF4419 domain-containing protein [Myxococcota bacterium]